VALPAANGTTLLIGLLGNACAKAGRVSSDGADRGAARAAAPAITERRLSVTSSLPMAPVGGDGTAGPL